MWIKNGRRLHRNYNWKAASLYAINVRYVDPRGEQSTPRNIIQRGNTDLTSLQLQHISLPLGV
ncbi:MAG: hypothetical protein F7B60_04940 [Desulfurococcales archaeon]|nr:hypothetical protein [Desulfurococcales archaeon]